MKLIAVLSLFGALFVVARDLEFPTITRHSSEATPDHSAGNLAPVADWPATAGGFRAKRGGADTNAELMQR